MIMREPTLLRLGEGRWRTGKQATGAPVSYAPGEWRWSVWKRIDVATRDALSGGLAQTRPASCEGQGGGPARSPVEAGSCRWREGVWFRERAGGRQGMVTGLDLTGSQRVRKRQTALHASATAEPERRFHALIDKVWRQLDFFKEAYGRVRRNGGVSGVDVETRQGNSPQPGPISVSLQSSRKGRNLRLRLGCLSLRKALASIWRIRSRVTLNNWPTSSRV